MNELWFTSDNFDDEEDDNGSPIEHVVDSSCSKGPSEFVTVAHLC